MRLCVCVCVCVCVCACLRACACVRVFVCNGQTSQNDHFELKWSNQSNGQTVKLKWSKQSNGQTKWSNHQSPPGHHPKPPSPLGARPPTSRSPVPASRPAGRSTIDWPASRIRPGRNGPAPSPSLRPSLSLAPTSCPHAPFSSHSKPHFQGLWYSHIIIYFILFISFYNIVP